jgi:ATP-dependent helicase HepA
MDMACAFVEVDRGLDGIGKLVEFDETWAEVEYFKSPAGPCLERVRVPFKSVRVVELSAQTRIFWFDTDRHSWLAGRVDGGLISALALHAKEDHYHVRFPNGREARIPLSQLYTRWAHPIEDPTDYLAAQVTDTPFFFEGRWRIVRHISGQRAAFGGLTGLASAAVELLEHQVAIVRRVLGDPIERYLLADEVGLGKTIEAGILIRQHIIDQPHEAKVLVIVPGHLVQQWKDELRTKFFLASGSSVEVVSESALLNHQIQLAPWTMLIVDEAHRTAKRAFSHDPCERRAYQELRWLAKAIPRVLLLSGTPVLHQEDGFLAMLHLLDPDAYPLEDRDSFRRRVQERQAVAEATADLMDDASSLFVEDAIKRLENSSFRADTQLMKLCSVVRAHLFEEDHSWDRISALRALRTHLTETYRLHRRLLRTRRGDPRVQSFLPIRTGLVTVQHEDQSRLEAFDFLDAWRLALSPDEIENSAQQELFAAFVAAALSHPRVLLRQIEARCAFCSGSRVASNSGAGPETSGPVSDSGTALVDTIRGESGKSVWLVRTAEGYVFSDNEAKGVTGPVNDQNLAASLRRLREHGWTAMVGESVLKPKHKGKLVARWAFEGEKEFLEQRHRLIAETLHRDDRAIALGQWLLSNSDIRKVIVFVDDSEVADTVAHTLQDHLPSQFVLRYRGKTEDIQTFEAMDTLTVLVCDAGAEEGLNLQRSGAVIVHYDLPLEPARIEQRIGRVDRIEARGRLRNVAFSAGLAYERDWLACLDRAIRVFNRSVAPLQYALAEATDRIRASLVHDGQTAIQNESARLTDSKSGLESELRRIQAQEAIDAIDIDSDTDAQFFEALVDHDESITVGGEKILSSWVTDRLQFGRQHLGRSTFRYFHDLRRPTLLPLRNTIESFQECVDRQAATTWIAGVPLQPVTLDRAIAETAHIPLLRVGHPFMQALEALIRSDDRGTAFAVWRYMPNLPGIPQGVFRFDFVIEADLGAFDFTGPLVVTSKPALRRRADEAFPVDYRTVWLTSDLEEIKDPNLLTILARPYSKLPRQDGGRDLNLRSERWDYAAKLASLGDWSALCSRVRQAAERRIRDTPEFQLRCERYASRVRESAASIANAFSSRIGRLSGAARRAEEEMAITESRLAEALVAGIKCPEVRVDSAGVVFLSAVPLEKE